MNGPRDDNVGVRVLAADDDADLRSLIEIILRSEGYDVRVVEDGPSALAVAPAFRPHLVLLDVMMPGMDGLEVCEALRAGPTTSTVPIIMLTAKGTPADAVAGLRAGANDYIVKPFDADELVARITTTLRCNRDLRGVSPLTGLPGNFEILRQLGRLVAAPVQDFAFLHADLDNFKAFNDHYGFVRGDDAIRATAKVLQDVAPDRATRFLGHIGGDDFALIVAADDAETTAEAVVRAFDLQAAGLYDPADRARGCIEVADRTGALRPYPFLTISIGVASSAYRSFSSVHEVALAAAQVKALAKSDTGSSWRLDRRRGS